jgi:hypothetical protein
MAKVPAGQHLDIFWSSPELNDCQSFGVGAEGQGPVDVGGRQALAAFSPDLVSSSIKLDQRVVA